ncbi:ABC transporter permease [Acuticoccus kandeliae]|uniref:ABC transporter permease n=1 Tax=Acuticoccus kandeliae TaxID=2073160 RepID=UPI000D3ED358|nr:ABC transporter permease subunit [Acuticoccus kandeliae]
MAVVTTAYLVYLALPIALLVIGAFGETWTNTLLPSGATTRWFAEVAADPSFSRAFWTSLKVTLATCALATLIGLPLAYAATGAARGFGRLVRFVMMVPVAAPEITLGFGFLIAFSTAATPWLGSFWLLVAGHTLLTLPYLVAALMNDMEALGLADLEAAAATLGAGFWRRLFDIVVPVCVTSLFTGLVTVAAISIGEFQLSNLIAGFLDRTYPIVLLQAFYGATGFACAATVVLLVLSLLTGTASALFTAAAIRESR